MSDIDSYEKTIDHLEDYGDQLKKKLIVMEQRAQTAEAKLNATLDLLAFYRIKHPDYPRANVLVDILLDGRKKESE